MINNWQNEWEEKDDMVNIVLGWQNCDKSCTFLGKVILHMD